MSQKYRMRHKSVNTPLSHERLVGGLQDGGRGTHVTHFVQLYPQPLYTASHVRTKCRSWVEAVLTDVCLTGVLTDLCLTLYIRSFWYFRCRHIHLCASKRNTEPQRSEVCRVKCMKLACQRCASSCVDIYSLLLLLF